MEQTLEAQVEKRLAELPEDVRAAVLGADLDKHIQEIGATHQLHIDQIGVLSDEVLLAMLGFTELDKLSESIAAQAHIDAATAEKVAQDVSEHVFLPIRESMERFQETRGMEAEVVAIKNSNKISIEKVAGAEPGIVGQKSGLPGAGDPRTFGKQSPAEQPISPTTEKMLTEKRVTPPYKVDPYREPPE